MFAIWTAVKVIKADHPRFGTAGVVATTPYPDGSIGIKFDSDSQVEAVNADELQAL
jgi:hypothetical protein